MEIIGEHIFLKILYPEDVGEEYLSWMNDKEVTQFLESRWTKYLIDDLIKYVEYFHRSDNDFLFGIFLKENKLHIGNIKIGNINHIHRYADLGFLIGKDYWNKGYGTESIRLATKFAFNNLKLRKLFAGIYSNNIGSYKAFIKSGYSEVGILEKHHTYKGTYVDQIIVEKINTEIL
jgi:[ribosomal protein S5]-alanine N-acetyltransferase